MGACTANKTKENSNRNSKIEELGKKNENNFT